MDFRGLIESNYHPLPTIHRILDIKMALIDDEIRVLIVADDPLARAGLALLLGEEPACKVVGQVAVTETLDQDLTVYQPDVLLWDMGWEPIPSVRSTISQNLESDNPALDYLTELSESAMAIVVLLSDTTYTAEIWATGVQGLLLRNATGKQLLIALQTVTQGLVVIDPTLTQSLFSTTSSSNASLIEPLTPRELEVLQHLTEGLSNKAIAHRLSISEHTVKFHVNAILSKLNAQSRTEAVVQATRLGLILL